MNRVFGYIIAIVGLVGLLLTFNQVKKALGITLPSTLTNNVLTIVSLVIVVVGILLVIKFGNSRKQTELPIYHGKDVVGFRRVQQK